MKVTGSNVFSIAQRILTSQTIDYYKYDGRISNEIGLYVSYFKPVVKIKGNFQPVPRNVYQQSGLDFQKSYWKLWAKIDFLDINRNVSGDEIAFKGRRYQCQSATPWYNIDGWTEILCVDIGIDESVDDGYGIYGVYGGGG